MTKKLALVRIQDGAVLQTFPEGTLRVDVPDMKVQIHAPAVGWEGGGEIIPATEGPARLRIVEVEDAAPPEQGKRIASTEIVPDGNGGAREVATLEDIPPPPPEPTRAEKFDAAAALLGLTPDDLVAEVKTRLEAGAKA